MPFYFEEPINARTSQRIQLPNLQELIKTEESKHGKKSLDYQVIRLLGNQYSDVAKYLAIALARTSINPKWSMEDILAEIEEKTLIRKKFHKYLEKNGDKRLSIKDKKKMALLIWNEIIEAEGQKNVQIIDTIEKASEKANKTLAAEVTQSKTKTLDKMGDIENAILNALKFLKKFGEIDKAYEFSYTKYLNYRINNPDITTNSFINGLIGTANKEGVVSLTNEIQLIKDKYEFADNIEQYLQDIIETLADVPNILWPESDTDITSVEQLQKYFRMLRSNKEQIRGQKILKQYKKRAEKLEQEQETQKNSGITEGKFDGFLNALVTKLENIDRTDLRQFHRTLESASYEALQKNPLIIKYIVKQENLPVEGDEDAKDAAAMELSSLLARELSKRLKHIGRRPGTWK